MEYQVGHFLLCYKYPVSRGIVVQKTRPPWWNSRGFFFSNVLQLHQQRWVILRVYSFALWKIINDENSVLCFFVCLFKRKFKYTIGSYNSSVKTNIHSYTDVSVWEWIIFSNINNVRYARKKLSSSVVCLIENGSCFPLKISYRLSHIIAGYLLLIYIHKVTWISLQNLKNKAPPFREFFQVLLEKPLI
jgi:hypothetical protein